MNHTHLFDFSLLVAERRERLETLTTLNESRQRRPPIRCQTRYRQEESAQARHGNGDEAVMDIGVFQLLPRGRAATDREVVEQALWEVDFAERHGFESVWVTEHHFSGYGSIGVPSVYAAGIAQRTKRIRIGYAVAVIPLHHPLRLAEEISWVDHLSEGRLVVGVGPGFSPFEFGAFGVPVDERHARFLEGFDLLLRALGEPEINFQGRRLAIHPRPYTHPHPPFYW